MPPERRQSLKTHKSRGHWRPDSAYLPSKDHRRLAPSTPQRSMPGFFSEYSQPTPSTVDTPKTQATNFDEGFYARSRRPGDNASQHHRRQHARDHRQNGGGYSSPIHSASRAGPSAFVVTDDSDNDTIHVSPRQPQPKPKQGKKSKTAKRKRSDPGKIQSSKRTCFTNCGHCTSSRVTATDDDTSSSDEDENCWQAGGRETEYEPLPGRRRTVREPPMPQPRRSPRVEIHNSARPRAHQDATESIPEAETLVPAPKRLRTEQASAIPILTLLKLHTFSKSIWVNPESTSKKFAKDLKLALRSRPYFEGTEFKKTVEHNGKIYMYHDNVRLGLRGTILSAYKEASPKFLKLRIEDKLSIFANHSHNRQHFQNLVPAYVLDDMSACAIYAWFEEFAKLQNMYLPPAFCLASWRWWSENARERVIRTIVKIAKRLVPDPINIGGGYTSIEYFGLKIREKFTEKVTGHDTQRPELALGLKVEDWLDWFMQKERAHIRKTNKALLKDKRLDKSEWANR